MSRHESRVRGRASRGRVTLIGAGPGALDLLTRRAVVRLRLADLVLYDALVPTEVLSLARRARRFFVGKRSGRPGLSQAETQRLLIREALRGQHVVRLKSGDPFVFGRGGEEALALDAAGIPFEVVPGVSSALAAPALAGIPVTHRGVAAGAVIVSGHAPAAYESILGSLSPHSATIITLMGGAAAAEIGAFLIHRGWSLSTPVAAVFAASQAGGWTWWGDLAGLTTPGREPINAAGAPTTLVIGDTVAVGEQLRGRQLSSTLAASGGLVEEVSHARAH